jgi:group I intron endonuclease
MYIGITSQKPKERFSSGRGYYHNEHFKRAILLYGWENIEHKIIQSGMSREEAIVEEKRLIAFFDTTNYAKGYNLMTGGDGVGTHTAETREKLRKLSTGKKWTQNQREKQSQRLLGHTLPKESKELLRQKRIGNHNPFYGKKHTEETKQIIRERTPSKLGGKSNLAKSVQKLDANGRIICEYDAITTAAKENGIASPYNISGCIRGKQRTCGGFMWRYAAAE